MKCPFCNAEIPEDVAACPSCGAPTGEKVTPARPQGMARRAGRLRDWLSGYAFLLPNILGFLTFTFLPVLASLLLSFFKWDAITDISQAQFVGLKNFIDVLGFHRNAAGQLIANDERFWFYCYNTIFLMMAIPIGMAGSLALALLLNQKLRGIVAYRTIYFLPTVCHPVALCLLWRWIYNAEYGLLNGLLFKLGVQDPPAWLNDPHWAKPALIIMGLWAAVGGYNCILYLAGLQNIPVELYEAAQIDGANWWHRFRYVTWPMLLPTTFFIFVMSVIAGFQGSFTQVYILTKGGPAGATTTIIYYIYQNAFNWFKMGYAAAIAWILFTIIFVVTLINWRFGKQQATFVA